MKARMRNFGGWLLLGVVTLGGPTAFAKRAAGIPVTLDETMLASTFDPGLPSDAPGTQAEGSRARIRAALVSRNRKKDANSRLMARIAVGRKRHEVWLGDFDVRRITATEIQVHGARVLVTLVLSDFSERAFEIRPKGGRYAIGRRHKGQYGGPRPVWARAP